MRATHSHKHSSHHLNRHSSLPTYLVMHGNRVSLRLQSTIAHLSVSDGGQVHHLKNQYSRAGLLSAETGDDLQCSSSIVSGSLGAMHS